MAQTSEHVAVEQQTEHSRFAVLVNGDVAGFAEYRERGEDLRAFIHTEVGEAYQGRGLAKQLIAQALHVTREQNRSVLPYCPMVRGFIAKTPEYLDLVPPERRKEFELDA